MLLVLGCMEQLADDGGLPQGSACLQSMQTFDKDQPLAVPSNQDRRLLAMLQHAFGDFLDQLWIQSLTSFYRHIDLVDCESLVLQHGWTTPLDPATPTL